MVKFIAKRLAISVVLLFIVTTLVFAFVHMMPGDPVLTMLGVDSNPDPVKYEKGCKIKGLENFKEKDGYYVFHAGSKFDADGNIVTNGGSICNHRR